MTSTFAFRSMVQAYYGDQRVRSAVDELLTKRFGESPSLHFEWDEFGSYVDAWLAAQQTAAEWAKDLSDIWDHVWGKYLANDCPIIPRPTAAVTADIAMGGIREAWFDGWYGRVVRSKFGPVGLIIFGVGDSFSLQIEFEKKAPKIDLHGWSFDREEVDSPPTDLVKSSGEIKLELSQLQIEAKRAISALSTN